MKLIKNLLMAIGMMAIVGACLKQPEYSIVPQISFKDLYFGHNSKTGMDSIVISVDFKDGDGDLGLDPVLDSADIEFKNPLYAIYCQEGIVIYVPLRSYNLPSQFQLSNGSLVTGLYYIRWSTKKALNPDTLPDINCNSWQEIRDLQSKVLDTMYVYLNPNQSNFFVDLFVKNGSTFTKFEEGSFPACTPFPFDGRFTNLTNDRGKNSPLEGTIHYSLNDPTWSSVFSNKTLKLRYHIQDRALHKSNVLETNEFTLASITR